MSFDDLPMQPMDTLSPTAVAFAERVLAMSKAARARTRCVADVEYGNDYWQKVDIFLPNDHTARDLPVLLFLHGGGWTHGYKEWSGFMAPAIVAFPAIFVSVSYRLAPTVRYPAPLEDTITALEWTWRQIADHGGNPDRLFLGGHSAGGHLAAMAALRTDLLAARGLPRDVIKACFPMSSSFRFEVGELEAMGKLLLTRPEDAPDASPLNFVDGCRVPFFIAHGEHDFERVRTTSAEMLKALEREGVPAELQILAGLDHFQANMDIDGGDSTWLRTVRTWMTDAEVPSRAAVRA